MTNSNQLPPHNNQSNSEQQGPEKAGTEGFRAGPNESGPNESGQTQTGQAQAGQAHQAPSGQPQQTQRPKPQFGELAPEGWNWQPPETPDGTQDGDPPTVAARNNQPQFGSGHDTPASTPETPGRLAGVPHNLGARGSQPRNTPQRTSEAPNKNVEDSYRADSAPQPPEPHTPMQPKKTRPKDRPATIALLVAGALGALILASSMREIPQSIVMVASTVGLDDFTLPVFVRTLSTVGAIMILAYWAIALLWSIERIRHRKLSFWIPLIAGVVALITVLVLSMIALYASIPPEVLQDPQTLQKLLESLQ